MVFVVDKFDLVVVLESHTPTIPILFDYFTMVLVCNQSKI